MIDNILTSLTSIAFLLWLILDIKAVQRYRRAGDVLQQSASNQATTKRNNEESIWLTARAHEMVLVAQRYRKAVIDNDPVAAFDAYERIHVLHAELQVGYIPEEGT